MVRTGRLKNEEQVLGLLNPRQKACWGFYTDPKSETFGNGIQSALKAGYPRSSAKQITVQTWFTDRILRLNLLGKAEKVLDKTLTMETMDEKGKEQADLLRIQNDTAKFVAKTLGKDEGYSERSELTGKDGSPIVFMPPQLLEKYGLLDNNETK